jgi:hypothetical protein
MFLQVGLGGLQRSCGTGDGDSCKTLGDWWAGKYDPSNRDPDKARSFYQQACQAGQKEACKADVGKGPPGKHGPPPPPPPPGKHTKPIPPPPPPPKKSK